VKEFEYKSEKEYVWKGDIIDYDGNIVIFCQKGEIFGHEIVALLKLLKDENNYNFSIIYYNFINKL
jgi:3-mercaptopyruvate sulfurtransferase SseA